MELTEDNITKNTVKLTQYSHGAGCGCKIAPEMLDRILAKSTVENLAFPSLVVGNDSRDDAAVMDVGNGLGIISTTDFFMPIVDDPFSFGQIAATNAISDIYAMGGNPLMAVAILGWPTGKLGPDIAATVIDGGRFSCQQAGIPLAGGHSIDTPEPVFGLAVTGSVAISNIRQNNTAKAGDLLFLTKPLGVGILSTAQKMKKILPEHQHIASEQMKKLNKAGSMFATLSCVHAMTDVTGFGLLGHLLEVCEGSGLTAEITEADIPLLPEVNYYQTLGCAPGGAVRNYKSYGGKVSPLTKRQQDILCDPQTSGGLLVTVDPDKKDEFLEVALRMELTLKSFGRLISQADRQAPLICVI